MALKERNEIPPEVAAKVLFLSHRTCCVCREAHKPVQIHHVDENPSNGVEGNLAVLCFDCHHETQLRGGFARKLDGHQILLYRDDWYRTVERHRHGAEGPTDLNSIGKNSKPIVTEVIVQNKPVHLGYLKLTESDRKHRYTFNADYPQVTPDESTASSEANLSIASFVTSELQRFRAQAIETTPYKQEMEREFASSAMNWDDLSITHSVGLFIDRLLTLEFQLWSYGAGAAHPNSRTKTMNFLLDPSLLLDLDDLFHMDSGYVEVVSKYCITDLHRQLPAHLREVNAGHRDTWILGGAGPERRNFEKFLLVRGGLRIFFDAYTVGSYAEGRREVFLPVSTVAGLLKDSYVRLLR